MQKKQNEIKEIFLKVVEEFKYIYIHMKKISIQKVVSKILSKKKLPILNECKVENGILKATNLELELRVKTDLKDGMYRIIGNDFVPTQTDPEEYPNIPEVSGNISWTFLNVLLSDTLKKASVFINRDYNKPCITGAYFKSENDFVNIITTDSFRMYLKKLPAKIIEESEFIIFDPKKVANILPVLGEKIDVVNGIDMVKFSGENGELSVRVIDDKFPDCKSIIPKWNWRLHFDRKKTLSALKEIKPYANEKTFKVDLEYDDEKLTITAKNEEASKSIIVGAKIEAVETASNIINNGIVVMPIQDEKMAFNIKYLIDILNSLEDNDVYFYSVGEDIMSPYFFSNERELLK